MKMTRKETNLEILRLMYEYAEANPDMRFGQILSGSAVIMSGEIFDPENRQLGNFWWDEYYLESDDLLKRVAMALRETKVPPPVAQLEKG